MFLCAETRKRTKKEWPGPVQLPKLYLAKRQRKAVLTEEEAETM